MPTRWMILLIMTAGITLCLGCSSAPASQVSASPTSTLLSPSTTPSPVPSATPLPAKTSPPTAVSPTSTPDVPIEKVTFTTGDGIQIAATLFGDGDLPILMLHMGKGAATGNDQLDWHPIARRLAAAGYSTLTVDFRGRGDSGGEFENDPVILDAWAALDFLRQRGFSRYACLGAGLGGTTCMVMALEDPPEALIVLSSSLAVGQNNTLAESDLTHLSMPKLFAYGERDSFGFPAAMQTIHRRAADPKALLTCDTAAHGSDLFYGSCGEDIYQSILSLLKGVN